MLTSLRKFSGSIYAKIFLGIIIIPFVFWGMGSSIVGGSKNILLMIDKEKYSVQDFTDFIKTVSKPDEKINSDKIEELLSIFIGEKLIENEVNYFGIKLSNNSLSELVKNQKDFKRDNKFSRIEYEKFLLKNNIPAVIFEANLAYQEKKKQLLDYIGGGLVPPKFLVNISYDKMNQKRNIQLIDLNDAIKKKLNFSEKKIISYYEDNKDDYKEIYKSVNLIELSPLTLTGSNEFNDIFFTKIDEIDNIIMQGVDLDYIVQKFDLIKANSFTFNESGKNTNSKLISSVPVKLSKKIFLLEDSETTVLIEAAEKYFLVEVIETKNIIKNLKDENVRKNILSNLKVKAIRDYISKIGAKINQNNFVKSDFDKFSKDENLPVKIIRLNNWNDDKVLNKEYVEQIYNIPEKKVVIFHREQTAENYLIYIDKIENATIDEKLEEYKKYSTFSKVKLERELINTYDKYLKKKYKIDINFKTLETVKNYFN